MARVPVTLVKRAIVNMEDKYKVISPLGERIGIGTYDTFYNTEKFESCIEAMINKDAVCVNFVQDQEGIIYFEYYNIKDPDSKKYLRLGCQHFPFGIDTRDDWMICEYMQELL